MLQKANHLDLKEDKKFGRDYRGDDTEGTGTSGKQVGKNKGGEGLLVCLTHNILKLFTGKENLAFLAK
ncbi:MAG TPA: hypothetical protein VMW83_02635 [Spirochaetia bacterium]|nr:hypothetical protein [Spirochaetia bacterium]